MEILLNGESAFLVKTTSGAVICDPATAEESQFVAASAADDSTIAAVLYSDPEHRAMRGSRNGGHASISRAGEYELGDLGLRGIALRGDESAESRTTSTSYRIDAEGIAVYALGQPSVTPDNRTVQMIGHVDVLLLDATRLKMNPKEISNTISSLDPSLVIVNGVNGSSGDPLPLLAALLGEIGAGDQQTEPQTRISVTRSSLPDDRQLVILKPR